MFFGPFNYKEFSKMNLDEKVGYQSGKLDGKSKTLEFVCDMLIKRFEDKKEFDKEFLMFFLNQFNSVNYFIRTQEHPEPKTITWEDIAACRLVMDGIDIRTGRPIKEVWEDIKNGIDVDADNKE